MSLRQLLILSAVLVTSAAAWEALSADVSDNRPIPDASTLKQLQNQVSALEERVKALEDQLTGVRPAAGVTTPMPFVSPHIDADCDRVPPTWKRGETNGVRFYTISLGLPEEGK